MVENNATNLDFSITNLENLGFCQYAGSPFLRFSERNGWKENPLFLYTEKAVSIRFICRESHAIWGLYTPKTPFPLYPPDRFVPSIQAEQANQITP
jgi:hypothetical protein